MQTNFVIGIDQSLRSTGVCLLGKNKQHVDRVVPGHLRGVKRLDFIVNRVETLLRKYHPYIAVMEGYSYHSSGRTFELGEIGGLLKWILYQHKIKTYIVPPASLKRFAGVKSQNSKALMVAAASRLGFKTKSDDEADAFLLATLAATIGGIRKTNTRCELEVCKQITNNTRV